MTESTLIKFLQPRKVEGRGASYALTGMGSGTSSGVTGKWMVTDSDYPQLLDELNDHLFIKKNRPLNLVEQRRADKMAPLLLDLDFKYPPAGQLIRRFNADQIKKFIKSITGILSRFFDLSEYDTRRFFVSLRPMPYPQRRGEPVIKDGIHISCPDLVLSNDDQQVLRAIMLEDNVVRTSFDGTGYINADKDVYDEAISSGRNGWLYYGETKPDLPPYLLAFVYEFDPQRNALKRSADEYTPRELLEILSIRFNLPDDCTPRLREEMQDIWDSYKRPVAPVAAPTKALTGGGAGHDDDIGTVDLSVNDTVTHKMPDIARYVGYDELEIETARRIARDCLSVERLDGFQSWMEVGWCLHTIDSSMDMFEVWVNISAKSPKFRAADVPKWRADWINNWNRDESRSTLTMNTLRWWAKQDNLPKYKEICDDDVIDMIMRLGEATHTHVAQIMHRLFSDNYKSCAEARTIEWFEYKQHVWRKLAQAMEIRQHISMYVADLVRAAQNRVRGRFGTMEGRALKDSEQFKKFENLIKFERNLYNAGFKDSVMKECAEQFRDNDNFLDKLDANPYLLGCANGVLNLRAGDPANPYVEFRKGRPDDYVSFQVGKQPGLDALPYMKYDPSDPIYEEIENFFAMIFPDIDQRDYMWRLLASCLEGANQDQEFYIWTGRGGNGKSILTNLMRDVLGDYACTLPTTALTRRRGDGGAASPELLVIKNKRFIYMSEPDENEPLNTSQMKSFSGEDYFQVRGLFKEPIQMKIAGKMFILCNKLIPINSSDDGTWRRMRVDPFPARFVEAGHPDYNPEKHVYHKDLQLPDKLRKWRPYFFSKLVNVYEHEYLKRLFHSDAKSGLNPVPAIISASVREYKESYDSFAKFMNNCMCRGGKANGTETTFNEIRRAYSAWYADQGSNSGARKYNDIDLKSRIINILGDPEVQPKRGEVFRHVKVFMSLEDKQTWEVEA